MTAAEHREEADRAEEERADGFWHNVGQDAPFSHRLRCAVHPAVYPVASLVPRSADRLISLMPPASDFGIRVERDRPLQGPQITHVTPGVVARSSLAPRLIALMPPTSF